MKNFGMHDLSKNACNEMAFLISLLFLSKRILFLKHSLSEKIPSLTSKLIINPTSIIIKKRLQNHLVNQIQIDAKITFE